jgi:hypothetical protein
MVTTFGVSHVLNAEPIGVSVVRVITLTALTSSVIGLSIGALVALTITLTGVMIVMSTMQTDAIDVQMT